MVPAIDEVLRLSAALVSPMDGGFVGPKAVFIAAVLRAFPDRESWQREPAVSAGLADLRVPVEWLDDRVCAKPDGVVSGVTRPAYWFLKRTLRELERVPTGSADVLHAMCLVLSKRWRGRRLATRIGLRGETLNSLERMLRSST